MRRQHAIAPFLVAIVCLIGAAVLGSRVSELHHEIFLEEFVLQQLPGTSTARLESLTEQLAREQWMFAGAAAVGACFLAIGFAIVLFAPKPRKDSLYNRYRRTPQAETPPPEDLDE